VEQGKRILADSGLDIIAAGNMREGAERAVAAARRA
jgi:succinyl-CoA synthetase beta subunit